MTGSGDATLTLEATGPEAASLGPACRKRFHATGGTIGRAPDNDWVLPHASVSGRHAEITFENGVFLISDTSTNGVFFGSLTNRLPKGHPTPINPGELIIIQPYRIQVSLVLPVSASPSPVPGLSPTGSATAAATPGAGLDSPKTPVVTPASPRPQQPPKPSPPPTPPLGPASTGTRRPATGGRAGLPPVVRLAAIVGSGVVVLAAVAIAMWMLWLNGSGGETVTTDKPEGGAIEGEIPPAPAAVEHLLTIDMPSGGTIEGDAVRCGSGGADCSISLPPGAEVRLTARPDDGFAFARFTGDCAPDGVTTMAGPRRCGATFARAAASTRPRPAARTPAAPSIQWWVLTITRPTGGTILGDNIECGPDGSECEARFPGGYPVTLRYKAEPGHTFGAFTGDCSPEGKTVMTAARTCGATFVKAATPARASSIILTVKRPTDGTIIGNGIECGPPMAHCVSPQPAGASVRLMARPKPGFVFTGFTGDCDAGGVAVMTAPRACGATFAREDARLPGAAFPPLTVTRPRHGTIFGPGIECGTGGSRCKAPQPAGSTLLLRVQPDPGYFFARFTGDCDAGGLAVMNGPKGCAVSILSLSDGLPKEAGYPPLTITRPTGGTVLGNGIECGTAGSACSAPQPGARQIRLLARPDVGFVFIRFAGDCDVSGVAMMDRPRTCTAVFAKGGQ